MKYADVCVDAPVVLREGSFSYSIPVGMDVKVGHAVIVPFGPRTLQGIVVGLTNIPAVEATRDIIGIVGDEPTLTKQQIKLAILISNYYRSSLFQALSLFLPPGFSRKSLQYIYSVQGAYSEDPLEMEVIKLLRTPTDVRSVLKSYEKDLINSMLGKKLLRKEFRLDVPRIRPKYERWYDCSLDDASFEAAVSSLKRSASQKNLLTYLYEKKHVPSSELKEQGFTSAAAGSLCEKGFISFEMREVIRGSISIPSTQKLRFELTPYQKHALDEISSGIAEQKGAKYLLHGVTGSGKTEVYLRAAEEALNKGKRVIVLVPEITLTSQIVRLFSMRFPGRVAVTHSGMTLGERYDQWRQIKKEKCDIVIGARSAIFSPVSDLGLVIVDEEHEYTYKQTEGNPPYHVTRIAETLCKATGCVLVLGSATPDVTTYYAAMRKRYKLLTLPERINGSKGTGLRYAICDMRKEAKAGNRSIFSRILQKEMKDALDRKEQIILFLNRRGDGQFVQCRECGYVVKCTSCNISMTYHSDKDIMLCHRCNAKKKMPVMCPGCGKGKLDTRGIGTQTVEREIQKLFPEARCMRWDSDAAREKDAVDGLMKKMLGHEVDILIGTQAIAKGLHFPNVTLVGVVSADMALNLPDFRACERTFQLISQAAGRAGRGEKRGTVIVQSYAPENYAIRTSVTSDYKSFYEQEIELRRKMNYPPFSKLAVISAESHNEEEIINDMQSFKNKLLKVAASKGIALEILGPTVPFIARRHGLYRYELTLRGNFTSLLVNIFIPKGWSINVDPLGI